MKIYLSKLFWLRSCKRIIDGFFLIFQTKLISIEGYRKLLASISEQAYSLKEQAISLNEHAKQNADLNRENAKLRKLSVLYSPNAESIKYERIESSAQLCQDLFVLRQLNWKSAGFFVEIGAASGTVLSNTFLLEKDFNWKGIVVEPGKYWHQDLKKNRKCIIDFRCIWDVTGEWIEFNDVNQHELSTIHSFSDGDMHRDARKDGEIYLVETITLNDLLDFHDAPFSIDYISIDTEGSEAQILRDFNFEKYKTKIFTIEHNFTKNRKIINELMLANGYTRVFENISEFDDWYVKDWA